MNTHPSFASFKAVLFDYDGVLVDSESTHFQAWMQLLSELKLEVSPSMIHQNVGKTAPTILSILLDEYRPGWDPEKINISELAQRKTDLYFEFARKGLTPYPGVKEGTLWLQSKKIKMAVVSNARRKELLINLEQMGIASRMETILSREDVPSNKPNPIPYLMAAGFLNYAPHECVAVEDSPTGLEAALLAGVPVVAVTTSFSKAQLETPIPGRPDLKPFWITKSIQNFFDAFRNSVS